MKTLTIIAYNDTVDVRICEHLHKVVCAVYQGRKNIATAEPEFGEFGYRGKTAHCKIGNVHLGNKAKCAKIKAAYEAETRRLTESKEYKVYKLRQERAWLASEYSAAVSAWHDSRERMIDAVGMGDQYKHDEGALQAEIDATAKAIAEFDAAHPEIKAMLDNEKAESVKRNMWN